MALEDVLPDDNDTSSSSSSTRRRRRTPPEDDDDRVVIGSEPNRKVFSQEKWEEVQKVIRDEMEYSVNEVKHLPAQRRYEVLHEAATWNSDMLTDEQEELKSTKRCIICNKHCSDSCVEIAGHRVHIHHTAGQINKELKERSSE